MSAVADVLNGAADLIERHGWWNPSHRSMVGFDLIGAIDSAAGGAVTYAEATNALRRQIGTQGVTEWNADPVRTKAEVVAALRAAAERAK